MLRLYVFALAILQDSRKPLQVAVYARRVSAAIDPAISAIAAEVLTDGQREVWELVIQGESQRAVSYRLDVARTTVVDRFDAANRRLRARGVRFGPDGRPYLPL